MNYVIVYLEQASDDLQIVKKDKIAFKRFERIKKALIENPFSPNLPNGFFPENGIQMKNYNPPLYHLKLTDKNRVFYSIDNFNNKIIINNIETDGNVVLHQLLDHDYKGGK